MGQLKNLELWIRGLIAAAISSLAGGVVNGLASIGVDPTHFNLGSGLHNTLRMAGAGAVVTGIIGVAGYLQKSPLPNPEDANGNPH